MMKLNRILDTRVSLLLLMLTGTGFAELGQAAEGPAGSAAPAAVAAAARAEVSTASAAMFDVTSWTAAARWGIDTDVLALALESAERAIERGDTVAKTLAVIDFSKPSTDRRLWVLDLRTRNLLFHEHVAHGRNSGHNMATSFSNENGSNQSSLGLFRGAETYVGKHGYSLRLDGLEKGVNDRARERAIVIHGADYVNGAVARTQGRLGRSLGCPAVRPEISRKLIDSVKEGGLLFAYYPDPAWLSTSEYLND